MMESRKGSDSESERSLSVTSSKKRNQGANSVDDARTRFIEPALRGPHLLKISRSIPSTFTLVEQPLGPSSWMEPKT